MTVFNSLNHASSRRTSALTDQDYDHEISLIDRTKTRSSLSPSPSTGEISEILTQSDNDTSRRNSDSALRKRLTLREELARRNYSKYQDRREGKTAGQQVGDDIDTATRGPAQGQSDHGVVGNGEPAACPQPDSLSQPRRSTRPKRESAVDILWENQRGGFLCGLALFSGKALGAADAPPWTNIAQKASATNITNAQVPDPDWEWASPEWTINHSEWVDQDGWEYSFLFSDKFSWHGPSWWNSFVRRRAWIRKRVKKNAGYEVQDANMLNSDYFAIQPRGRSLSPNKASMRGSRNSSERTRQNEEILEFEEIKDIDHLIKALKLARIDREKTEAVESFIEHGGEDLYYLREGMPDIMGQFIFQASRRLLLAHLSQSLDEALSHQPEHGKDDKGDNPIAKHRIDYLEAAVGAADEEVKRLEFWSDIKQLAEQGETKGGVDENQGWNKEEWIGLDDSGPKDVISDRNRPIFHDEVNGNPNGNFKGERNT